MEVYPQFSQRPSESEIRALLRTNVEDSDEVSSDDGQIRTYKRRWYILILFSLVCFTQGLMWNTFGPISTSSERVFDWEDSTIAWLSALGGLAFLLTSFPMYWLMQTKGLRWAMLLSSLFLMIGSTLRIITSEAQGATFLINMGQFIIGFATPVAMGASPSLSATWFPQDERVTATAISSSIGVFGVASAFVLGPLIVERGLHHGKNTTDRSGLSVTNTTPGINSNDFGNIFITDENLEKERQQIMQYLYIQFVWACVLFFTIVCYFPHAPPRPPSISAVSERHTYWTGLRSLFRNINFVIISLTYGFTIGVFGAWQSVLTLNLKPAGISQEKAGWLGFYSVVSGCLASVLVGRFADKFIRHMKQFILVMYTLATACFALFSLELLGIGLPHSEGLLYASVICGGSLLLGAMPMMFELGCEIAYPTSESAANGMFAFFNNLTGVIFMIPFAIPHVGTIWMNWVFTGFCLISLPLVAMVKSTFNRLNLDENSRQ
ncbi:hypothetical protein RRG08_028503 [Elysia crispata]|uniref:Major facilitator superfamily (MFS) profile domain-containing protein n=1 Tax=Elysia crispata TaxID=231223 RepID=A0AAE0ZJ15_9GAST|nr:hypothetical protein RRG08_028503 [Elysia crispata]